MLDSEKYTSTIKMPSFEELGIDKAKVLRVIESLKVNGNEVHPGSIALELGIPRTFIYENWELLDLVYSNMDRSFGHDKLIMQLVKEKSKLEKKISKYEKQIEVKDLEAQKNYNLGFSQGASINYEKNPEASFSDRDLSIEKEIWARSVLYIELDRELDLSAIKKAYRKMVSLIHPDVTHEDTSAMMNLLKNAYNHLLSKYN